MHFQILAEINLLMSKFTPGFDQTQKYFKVFSRKYFKRHCVIYRVESWSGVLEWSHRVESWSGFWSGMKSNLELMLHF